MNPNYPFNNRSLINSVALRPEIPDHQQAISILTSTIGAVNEFSVSTLHSGKGIIIPGFGVCFFYNHIDEKSGKPYRDMHFCFDYYFIEEFNLKANVALLERTYKEGNMTLLDKYGPIVRTNFAVVGYKTGFQPLDCKEGYELYLYELKRFIRSGADGCVDLGFGKFYIKNYVVDFRIFYELINHLAEDGVLTMVKTAQALTTTYGTFRPSESMKGTHCIKK